MAHSKTSRYQVLVPALVIVLFVCSIKAQTSDPSESPAIPDLSSMFSLKKLGEYNQLIECISKIRHQFTGCNEEAQRKGETVLKYVNEKSEMGTLLKCCGVWLVRDCWVDAATKGGCTQEQIQQLYESPQNMMPGLGSVCHKYPAGSRSCYTPHIVVGAILSVVFLLVILVLVAAFFVGRHFYRHRKGSTKLDSLSAEGDRRHDGHHDRIRAAEKVKLTSKSPGANGDSPNNNNNNFEYIDAEKGNSN